MGNLGTALLFLYHFLRKRPEIDCFWHSCWKKWGSLPCASPCGFSLQQHGEPVLKMQAQKMPGPELAHCQFGHILWSGQPSLKEWELAPISWWEGRRPCWEKALGHLCMLPYTKMAQGFLPASEPLENVLVLVGELRPVVWGKCVNRLSTSM